MSGVRRVVVGVSGSPASIRALRIAAERARREGVPLVAVQAWLPPGGDLAERRAPSPELRAVSKRAALERLQGASSPDDLLVIGAGARGTFARFWRGRVTRYCQARARCLVLAVPPPAPAATRWNRMNAWSFRHRELTADQVLHG